MHATNPSYGDENIKKLGLSFENITSCQFDKLNCKNDLHWIWLYDYGNCFQFDSGLNFTSQNIDMVKISRLGKDFGLNMILGVFYSNSLYQNSNQNRICFQNNDIVVFVQI